MSENRHQPPTPDYDDFSEYSLSPHTSVEPTDRRAAWLAGISLAGVAGIALAFNAPNILGGEQDPSHNTDGAVTAESGTTRTPDGRISGGKVVVIKGKTDADKACNALLAHDRGEAISEADITAIPFTSSSLRAKTVHAFNLETGANILLSADSSSVADTPKLITSWKNLSDAGVKKDVARGLVEDALSDVALNANYPSKEADERAASAHTIITAVQGKTSSKHQQVDSVVQLGKQTANLLDNGTAAEWANSNDQLTSTWAKHDGKATEIWANLDKQAVHESIDEVCGQSPEFKKNLEDGKKAAEAYDKECDTVADPDACKADRAIDAAKSGYEASAKDWADRVSPDNEVQQDRIDEAEADAAIDDLKSGYPSLAEAWDARIVDPAQRVRVDQAEADLAIDYMEDSYLTLGYDMQEKVEDPAVKDRVDASMVRIAQKLKDEGYSSLAADVAEHITNASLRNTTLAAINS